MRTHSADESVGRSPSAAASSPSSTQGKLILTNERNARFVDNDLWNSVGGELLEAHETNYEEHSETDSNNDPIDDSYDLILELYSTGRTSIVTLHPPASDIWKLWRVYLDNVNPLSKLVHRPVTEKLIQRACEDVRSIDRASEALLFAMYFTAVGSLSPDECQNLLSDSKSVLQKRYRYACRGALARAKFLRTSDLRVLTAFVIYLVSGDFLHRVQAMAIFSAS